MMKKIQKIKKPSMVIYCISTLITAFIFLMSTLLLPALFSIGQLHMNIRNGILIIASIVILLISGMTIPTMIYLIGNEDGEIRTLDRRDLKEYIMSSSSGILFFVISSLIWSLFSGVIALALFLVLKSNVSYECIKLIIQLAVAFLTIFIAPLLLMETFSMMLKNGTPKYRLKYGCHVCRRNYIKLLKEILLLFMIGLIISVIGLFLRISIARNITMFVLWSIFGGISLIYITEYILKIFEKMNPVNKLNPVNK